MPDRLSPRLGASFAIALFGLVCGEAAIGQQVNIEQMLIDTDALVVGTEVTTRCALFDASVQYLTPLEQVGAGLRLREIVAAASRTIEDMPDELARMHAEAAEIACGSSELVPYMDFSRQIARDMIDIALVAWRSIDIEQCNYFADDDFLVAVDRAHAAAERATIEGEPNRIAYIEERAEFWVAVFNDNCVNHQFQPAETHPGQIALALPSQ